jgi:hypothetical protein
MRTGTHEPIRALRPGVLVAVLVLAHVGVPAWLPADTSPMIEPQVRTAVAAGRARVLVELRIVGGMRPEGELATADASAQRNAIAAAQQSVVSRLAGADYSLSRRYTSVPLLALEVGADALAALEAMGDLVVRVRADRAVPPARNPTPTGSGDRPQGRP